MELGHPNRGKAESCKAWLLEGWHPLEVYKGPHHHHHHPMLIIYTVRANLRYLLDARITLKLSNKDAGGN